MNKYTEEEVVRPPDSDKIFLRFNMQPLNGVVFGEIIWPIEINEGIEIYNGGGIQFLRDGKEEISYANGKIVLSKVWYSNGKLFNTTTYDEDQQPEGEYKQWHSNGTLWHYNYKTITKPKEWLDLEEYLDFGINRSWYANGALQQEILYYNDENHGISNFKISEKQWYNSGQLRMHLNFGDLKSFGNGQKDSQVLVGTNKWWYENGNLEIEVYYKEEEIFVNHIHKHNSDGLWKSCDKNGKLEYEGSFKEGKNLGLFKKWDLNGNFNPSNLSVCGEFNL